MQTLCSILLWLLVIFLGISFGAGLYESRIVVPMWRESPPETWVNTGTAFWAFVTSGPLTLIVVACLFVVRRFEGALRPWWLAALCVALVERVTTFAYFIPTMISLQQQTGSSGDVSSTLATWSLLDHGRHLLTLAAWLLSLRALSLLAAGRPARTQTLPPIDR
jgi:hypothetical protein